MERSAYRIVAKDYWLAAELILQAMVNGVGDDVGAGAGAGAGVDTSADSDTLDMELGSWLGKYGRAYWFVKPSTKVLPNIVELAQGFALKRGSNANVAS